MTIIYINNIFFATDIINITKTYYIQLVLSNNTSIYIKYIWEEGYTFIVNTYIETLFINNSNCILQYDIIYKYNLPINIFYIYKHSEVIKNILSSPYNTHHVILKNNINKKPFTLFYWIFNIRDREISNFASFFYKLNKICKNYLHYNIIKSYLHNLNQNIFTEDILDIIYKYILL